MKRAHLGQSKYQILFQKAADGLRGSKSVNMRNEGVLSSLYCTEIDCTGGKESGSSIIYLWMLYLARYSHVLLFVVVVRFGFPPSFPQYFFRYLSFLKRFSRGDAAFPFNWPHGLIVHGIPAEMSP